MPMVATMKLCWICRSGLDPGRERGFLYDMHEVCEECKDALLHLREPSVVEVPLSPSSLPSPAISVLVRQRAAKPRGRFTGWSEILIAALAILAGVWAWEITRWWFQR